jgi:hypothetical protein
MDTEQEKEPIQLEPAETAPKRIVIGGLVAAAAFALVLFLMARAVRFSSSSLDDGNTGNKPKQGAPQSVHVERLAAQYLTNAAGIPELLVNGCIRNSSGSAVATADLKCRFRTNSGEETFLEIPLVIPTRLDDLRAGPLDPFSSREFSARVGDFPSDIEPQILDAELVHVSFSNL